MRLAVGRKFFLRFSRNGELTVSQRRTCDETEIPTLLFDSPRVNPLDVYFNNPGSDDSPPSCVLPPCFVRRHNSMP